MIPVSRPHYTSVEVDHILGEIRKVLSSGRLVNGPYLQDFENKFSEYIGCRESVGLNSGTSALEIALRCTNIEGGEVITTTNTCNSVINPIIIAGGKPVLIDIKQDTLAMDPKKLSSEITPETKAVIVVHIAGCIQDDIEEIQTICKQNEITLIEDSCRALGARRDGKLAGNFGDIACFSFYAAKLLSTGNGGMLTTNDITVSKKAKILREHGRSRIKKKDYSYTDIEIGHNMILDEFGAILGLSQLRILEKFIKVRTAIARKYDAAISNIGYLEKAINYNNDEDYISSYYRYPLILREDINAEDFEEHMNTVGVKLGHYPMVHQTQVYREKKALIRYGKLSTSNYLSGRLFSLPIFNSMSATQADKVIKSLHDFAE